MQSFSSLEVRTHCRTSHFYETRYPNFSSIFFPFISDSVGFARQIFLFSPRPNGIKNKLNL